MKSESLTMAIPRAGKIIGLAVINDQHQQLGKVEDIIVSSAAVFPIW